MQTEALFQKFLFLLTDGAHTEGSAGIIKQLFPAVKETDGYVPLFCLGAKAENMHNLGFIVDDKISDGSTHPDTLLIHSNYAVIFFIIVSLLISHCQCE